jgi:hypothetical protein
MKDTLDRELDELEQRIKELRRHHCPILNPGPETCFQCPILVAVELRGGALSDLCCKCVEYSLKGA